jgi:hypothetical protein
MMLRDWYFFLLSKRTSIAYTNAESVLPFLTLPIRQTPRQKMHRIIKAQMTQR